MSLKIIPTNDGSKTIFLRELNEQYHSTNGAITEARHVYLDAGYLFSTKSNPVAFEVGFGTGLNCLITAIEALKNKRTTQFISIEKYPLETDMIKQLNFTDFLGPESKSIFEKIHSCPWNKATQINEYFLLFKIKNDLYNADFSHLPNFDIIYYDAFGPDKQPEMWTPELFEKIFRHSAPNAVFVTYSAKGEVRRQLQKCGFTMERLPGPPGKKHMLRGIK